MSLLESFCRQTSFYLSHPSPCPYLQGKVEQKIFTRLSDDAQGDYLLNSALTQNGFRRSQRILYRPACPSCMACVPVRIALQKFAPGRSLKRVEKHNKDLASALLPVEQAMPLFQLFQQYQNARHPDSEMAQMTKQDFCAMLNEGGSHAFVLALKNNKGNYVAAILADRLNNGISAVYSFFDPSRNKRSLGTEIILRLAHQAKSEGCAYLYLGYWIRDSQKMAYKSRFPSLEKLGPDGWIGE